MTIIKRYRSGGIAVISVMARFFIGLLLASFFSVEVQARRNIRIERTHVFKESIPQLSSRIDVLKHSRMCSDYNHEVIFVIKQKNMDELSSFLHDVSDPLSDNYGQHMTARAVTDLTSNPEGRDSVVEYLHATGATVVAETLGGEYITATAPITVWEKMFDCEFYMFHQIQENEIINKVVRTESYSIPVLLNNHVESVFNTIEMPHENAIKTKPVPAVVVPGNDKFDLQATSYTTPPKLRNAYNMGTSKGSNSSTQCIYASLNQFFSPDDLSQFQTAYGLKKQTVSTVIGGHESSFVCLYLPSNCAEANLDVQYIMAASPASPTTYWYSDLDWFSEWLLTVANTPNPPLVFSISYGMEERFVTSSERDAFNTQAMKLGAMGVTIVAASGDDGAITRKVRVTTTECKYAPLFPASSPYVVAVGATMVSFRLIFE